MKQFVNSALSQDQDEGESDDGLELGICRIHPEAGRLTFAGARFSLFFRRGGVIEEAKGSRRGIGYRHVPMDETFVDSDLSLSAGMAFYMVSDGVIDQIGGAKRRSFGKRRLLNLLARHGDEPLAAQRDAVLAAFATYQGEEPRRDDVSLLGFVPFAP